MQLSIFTDEINKKSPERAIQLAKNWGVEFLEVRSFPNGRFPAVSDDELQLFYKKVTDAGMAISGVSPGFCKCSHNDPIVKKVISKDLHRACEWAKNWGIDLISCFGFDREGKKSMPQIVPELLHKMAEICKQHECRMVLENEAVCWGATGIEAANLIQQVDVDNFSLCWDPGNSARAGSMSPFPDEYEKIKNLVTHAHMKNFNPGTGAWSLMDDGLIDWKSQLAALKADNYKGFIVVETHLHISPDAFAVINNDSSGLENNTLHNLNFTRKCLEEI